MTAIRTVVFDVGGVLIDWNPRHLYRKLFDGDADAMEHFLAEVCSPAWNHGLDAGRDWGEAVAELVGRHPAQEALIRAYDLRWEEMVPGAHEDTVALVHALKARGVPLYSLTNFSREKFASERRRWAVFDLFDGIVVSGEVGMAKPDPAIFALLLGRHGLVPEACLYVDDVAANVAAAETFGMTGHLFRSAADLEADLRGRGLL